MGPEKRIEMKGVNYAKKHLGAIVRKMNGFGFAHWMDRLFLLPGCPELWVEFKKPGGKCTPMQLKLHSDLRAQGREVWVEDNADVFIKKLNAWYVMMRNTLPPGKPLGSPPFSLTQESLGRIRVPRGAFKHEQQRLLKRR